MSLKIHPIAIGSDYVGREGGYLVIYASVDMADWYVREYRKTAIFFEGERYFIASKSLLGDGRIRYVLEPWPDHLLDLPSGTICYDENYVRSRDEALKQIENSEYTRLFLLPLYPLIGFLPSSLKLEIEDRYGIDAYRATVYSLWIEYLCLFVHGALLVVATFTTMFNVFYLLGVIFLLLPDTLLRYDHTQKESNSPFGFYEWLFHFRLK
jgi:hypothetical protein